VIGLAVETGQHETRYLVCQTAITIHLHAEKKYIFCDGHIELSSGKFPG